MSNQDFDNLLDHLCIPIPIFVTPFPIVSFLGSECQSLASLIHRNSPASFQLLHNLNPTLPVSDLRNLLCMLVKHNLIAVKEQDLTPYYTFEARECLLRLSLPRYITRIRDKMGAMYATAIESVVIHGSLTKRELVQIMGGHGEKEVEELLSANYLTGVVSYSQSGEASEFPVRVNLLKCLEDERRESLIDFAEAKLRDNSPLDFKLLQLMINKHPHLRQLVDPKDDIVA